MHHFRNVSRIARLKWVPRTGLEEHGRQIKSPPWRPFDSFLGANAPNLHTASSWYIQEVSALSWVSPIGPGIRCFSHSVVEEKVEENATMERHHVAAWVTGRMAAAQRALMDYLHVTRGMYFTDAEHMSKHSPIFLSKLLKKVKKEAVQESVEGQKMNMWKLKVEREEEVKRIGKALARFFRYHPINEFEPFFESIGLKPSESDPLLPRDLMFLSDDEMLLENYRVLCNYGIARGMIGRIYRDATKVFGDDWGVLASKLCALEELGLGKSSVIKLVASSPVVLVGDWNADFLKVLQWLDDIGIPRDWIGGVLSEKKSYNWGKMLQVFQFFNGLGFSKEGIGDLIRQHPDFMLDGSGKMVFTLLAILLKAGAGRKELFDLFSNFPNVLAGNFLRNLQKGIQFLVEIDMCHKDIQKLVVSYPLVLGSAARLKKPSSIVTTLSVGKKRLCKLIMEEPHRLMKYTIGSRLSRLPKSDACERSLKGKVKFLTSIGFVEDSEDMKKALKVFRGKGDELQDRYDFLVRTGFDPKDVVNMIKVAPQILDLKIHVLETKIAFFVNNLGYPLSSLVGFPGFMSYNLERIKLRFFIYNWLRDRGMANPELALSSILACPDKYFMKKFVKKHPKGPEVWENYRRMLASS